MSRLTIKLNGGTEFVKTMDMSNKIVGFYMAKALNVTATSVQHRAQDYAPVDTSVLKNSILVKFADPNSNPMEALVRTNLKYAQYQEFGTGIYGVNATPIRPKRARFLKFKTKEGRIVYARQVKGTRPKKFMQRSVEDNRPIFDQNLKRAAELIVEKLAKDN